MMRQRIISERVAQMGYWWSILGQLSDEEQFGADLRASHGSFPFLKETRQMTKWVLLLAFGLLAGVLVSLAGQSGLSDDAGRVLALETAWNHSD